jgi:hypothetical protein
MSTGINNSMFDRFTFAHAIAGAVYGYKDLSPSTALLLAVGWELAERPLKANWPHLFPHSSQDTLANAAGDILATMIGYYLTRKRIP